MLSSDFSFKFLSTIVPEDDLASSTKSVLSDHEQVIKIMAIRFTA